MLTIGSDPEFFLKAPNGNHITAIGLLGGTKENPRKTDNGYIQEDGCAAEINSNPAASKKEFINNHNLILSDIKDILKPLNLQLDLYSPSVIFSDEQLSNPLANINGCDPDFDAWNLCENETYDLRRIKVRAAGGHLHIAFTGASDFHSRLSFTKVLDFQLGVPCVLLDDDIDRKSLYGKAGAHRPKYKDKDGFDGIEYRVLSNFWLRSDSYMGYVYDRIKYCNDNWESLVELADSLGDDIQEIINTSDTKLAKSFCKTHKVAVYE